MRVRDFFSNLLLKIKIYDRKRCSVSRQKGVKKMMKKFWGAHMLLFYMHSHCLGGFLFIVWISPFSRRRRRKRRKENIYQSGYMRKDGKRRKIDKIRDLILFDCEKIRLCLNFCFNLFFSSSLYFFYNSSLRWENV